MVDVRTRQSAWFALSNLTPIRVLDDVDGPRLFTAKADDGLLLLCYSCDSTPTGERYLVAPTTDHVVDLILTNERTLRDALLSQGFLWLAEQRNDGVTRSLGLVDQTNLPSYMLPREGIYLAPTPETLLRVRLKGAALRRGRVPASVVRRAVDGATAAVKVLIRHALRVQPATGRPPDRFRRYYDLPATEFAFRSFEVTFGMPDMPAQQELTEDKAILDEAGRLLNAGLSWASSPGGTALAISGTTEQTAVIEALSYLSPPQQGVVEEVEVSGALARSAGPTVLLTRVASEKVRQARKDLRNVGEVTYEGVVREFDKDKLTFWLRSPIGLDVVRVSFTEDKYNDALLAFDTGRLVTIFANRSDSASSAAELISIAFKGELPEALDQKP